MPDSARDIRRKWRPPMVLVVVLVCAALLAVPTIALLALRISTNRFVQETEQSLTRQAAIYAAVYATAFDALEGDAPGEQLSQQKQAFWNADVQVVPHVLNLREADILPTRPEGREISDTRDTRHLKLAPELWGLARRAKRSTLSGVVLLDHQGVDILSESALSFADLPEVQSALKGEVGAVLRWRGDTSGNHTRTSISRETGFRVFVTFPVIVHDRVVGIVYLSRTPNNLGKYLYEERFALLVLLGVTMLGAAILGALLLRLQLRPIRALRDQSWRVASGIQTELEPLPHYGTRELAELGGSVITMARSLSERSKEISTFTDHVTHELKSPVTGIIGAAELLGTQDLPPDARIQLVNNIASQGNRMHLLLAQLREMTQSRQLVRGGPSKLAEMRIDAPGLEVILQNPDAILPLSQEHGEVILGHMAQNALAHDATHLELTWDGIKLRISDNGKGLSATDLDRLTQPFFTTRREEGGTGMGLAICVAILQQYDASLQPVISPNGAVFDVNFQNFS